MGISICLKRSAAYLVFTDIPMKITGTYEEKNLAEIVELKNHPWFLAVQFHPEFKSYPNKPHPLFRDFIKAAKNQYPI